MLMPMKNLSLRTYGRIRGRNKTKGPWEASRPAWLVFPEQELPKMPASPKILEIGFGMGDSLYEMARQFPAYHFVGIEIYEPGWKHLAHLMWENPLDNLWIFPGDALECMQRFHHVFDRVHVFFPDPWPKKRHHKRRLHRSPLFQRLPGCMTSGGVLQMMTDWPEYADDWKVHLPASWTLLDEAPWTPITKYQQRGMRLGHAIVHISCQVC